MSSNVVGNTPEAILEYIKEKNIRFIDLRFTDTRGKEHHMTVTDVTIDADFFTEGKLFDGSSIAGWKNISSSDMILMPDPSTALLDPFYEEPTLMIRCDIIEPSTMVGYERDPRSVARRAQEYLKSTGIADICYFGPEPEFFLLDDVRWEIMMDKVSFKVDAKEACWNASTEYAEGNMGHRPTIKGGYVPVPPVDSSQDIRSAISLALEDVGLVVETHHHEVATGNQNEVALRFSELLHKADEIQMLKYVIHNVAHRHGKTATFMPKPLVGDNGSGMHCHQSLAKDGKNVFSGDVYAGLSEEALFYIGGILKHARSLNAFTNASTNSYKRLVPGYEAPVMLAYSARNRSASIRVPHAPVPKACRIEVRFPDVTANPYLAFSAMLMAGLDGIKNKIHPGEPLDKDLYDLRPGELGDIPIVCRDLYEAIACLKQDKGYLLEGGVFTEDMLDGYIQLKMQEVERLMVTTHPVEFEMYYTT